MTELVGHASKTGHHQLPKSDEAMVAYSQWHCPLSFRLVGSATSAALGHLNHPVAAVCAASLPPMSRQEELDSFPTSRGCHWRSRRCRIPRSNTVGGGLCGWGGRLARDSNPLPQTGNCVTSIHSHLPLLPFRWIEDHPPRGSCSSRQIRRPQHGLERMQ